MTYVRVKNLRILLITDARTKDPGKDNTIKSTAVRTANKCYTLSRPLSSSIIILRNVILAKRTPFVMCQVAKTEDFVLRQGTTLIICVVRHRVRCAPFRWTVISRIYPCRDDHNRGENDQRDVMNAKKSK